MPHELTITAPVPAAARLDDYFGLWAIEESRLTGMVRELQGMDFAAHFSQGHKQPDPTEPEVVQVEAAAGQRSALGGPAGAGGSRPRSARIAVVSLQGVLTKGGSSAFASSGTTWARGQIRGAMRDPDVDAICLVIDSPGGTTAGTMELAQQVAAARQQKPVYAYIEDLGASAAYWVASQAERIFANCPTCQVGSIGTLAVVVDSSKQEAKRGRTLHVIGTGELKGANVPGAPISDTYLAHLRSLVETTQREFDTAVMRGRGFGWDVLRAARSGAVFTAEDAQGKRLIDGIQSFEQTLAQLAGEAINKRLTTHGGGMFAASPSNERGQTPMPNDSPATIAELKQACPGASSDFLLAQVEQGASIVDAQRAFIKAQGEELAQQQAQQKRPGVEPVGFGRAGKQVATSGEDAIAAFNDEVAALTATGMPKHLAARRVVKENPELHESYLQAWNERHRDARRPGER